MNKRLKLLLDILLYVILIFFVTTLIFVIIELTKYKLNLSIDGFKFLYTVIMEYSNIYYALILITTIYIALNNYNAIIEDKNDRSKIAQGEFMLSLRKMFSLHDEVHFKFRGKEGDWVKGIPVADRTNPNYAKIDSYLGLFELCYHLIKRDLIDVEDFKKIYGYRLENLFANKDILKRLEAEKNSWTDLFELKNKLKI